MTRHQGGDKAKAGFYLNTNTWEVTTLSGKSGGTLPGGRDAQFLRVPTVGLLVFAPLMGAAYAMFLPFIGIALTAQWATKKAMAGVREASHSVMGTMTPAWRPGEAHFTGSAEKDEAKQDREAEPQVEERLRKIEDEIDQHEKK
jgi:hypothetical protein